MSTTKQKTTARKNLEKARAAGPKRKKRAGSSKGDQLSTAEKDDLPAKAFAFPKERKEPLTDAAHVRNAIARFDQVEGVTDEERTKAWKRITKAAARYDVEIEAKGWRELIEGGKTGRSKASRKKASTKKASTKRASKKKASRKKASRKKASTKRASTKRASTKRASKKKASKKKASTKKASKKKASTT